MSRDRQIEEAMCRSHQPFSEQRPPDLQHQLVIVLKTELENALHRTHGPGPIAQLQQSLTEPGQTVFMIRIERKRLFEAAARPSVLLTSEVGVGPSDMQFNG